MNRGLSFGLTHAARSTARHRCARRRREITSEKEEEESGDGGVGVEAAFHSIAQAQAPAPRFSWFLACTVLGKMAEAGFFELKKISPVKEEEKRDGTRE